VPDIHFRGSDWVSGMVDHAAGDEQRRARRIGADDAATVLDPRRIQPPEWTQQRLRGFGIALIAIVQETYQRGDSERAGHQDDFVVGVGGAFADLDQDGGGFAELRLGQPDVADKAVEMLDQRHHDLAQPRIGRLFHHGIGRDRDILLTPDDHSALPGRRPRQ
jgi:hypothetical protein